MSADMSGKLRSSISPEYKEKIARNGRLVRLAISRLQGCEDSEWCSADQSKKSELQSGKTSGSSLVNLKVLNSSPDLNEWTDEYEKKSSKIAERKPKRVKFDNFSTKSYMVRYFMFLIGGRELEDHRTSASLTVRKSPQNLSLG